MIWITIYSKRNEHSSEKPLKVSIGIRVKDANFLFRQLAGFYNIMYPSRH